MAKLNISQTKELLDGYLILIIDKRHARCLIIKKKSIIEKDLIGPKPIWEDKSGRFQGTSGSGISEKPMVEEEFRKRFYKKVLQLASTLTAENQIKNIVILSPEEDRSPLIQYLPKPLEEKLSGTKDGNYIRSNTNEILKVTLEMVMPS